MSSNDRPATQAFKERWNNLLAFWKERHRGLYDKDFTEWRMEMGLTPRTAKENYWQAGETLGHIRIIFEKKQKIWEHCSSPSLEEETATEYMQRKSAEKKPKLSDKAKFVFEGMEVKERMKAEHCVQGCSLPPDADCRRCSRYWAIRNQESDDLEEK